MRSQFLLITLSQTMTFVFGGNLCATTSKSNCADNIGDPCLNLYDGVGVGDNICCWIAESGGQQVGSGMAQCGSGGTFIASDCASGLTCHTDFTSCTYSC